MKNKIKFFTIFSFIVLVIYNSNAFAQPEFELVWQRDMSDYSNVEFAKFSSDGKYIYHTTSGHKMYKIDANSGETLSYFGKAEDIWDMKISENGNIIATLGEGPGINIWDTQKESMIKYIFFSISGWKGVDFFDITSDGKNLIICLYTYEKDYDDRVYSIINYDIEKNKSIDSIPFHSELLNIELSKDSKYFVTASVDGSLFGVYHHKLILWETSTFKQIKVLEDYEYISKLNYKKLEFSKDDKLLAVLRSPHNATIFNFTTNTPIKNIQDDRRCYIYFFPVSNYFLIRFYSDVFGTEWELHDTIGLVKKIDNYGVFFESFYNEDYWKILFFNSTNFNLFKNIETSIEPSIIKTDAIYVSANNNTLYIKYNELVMEQLSIIISDLLGKIIYTESIQVTQSNSIIPVNVNLNTGTYLCKVIAGNKEYTQKIQIVR